MPCIIRIFLAIFVSILFISCEAQDEKPAYGTVLESIESNRKAFAQRYESADSIEKESILLEAKVYLEYMLVDSIFPYWYGTRWDFNGITQTPGEGKIACGYFVTTTLRDLSFQIPRIKWAQMASEPVIKKLCDKSIKRFSNKSIDAVESYLIESGNGIYLVGMDSHVGFIAVKDSKIRFVHSSYYKPDIGVMSEELTTNNPLSDANYRVIGKLFSKEMVGHWISAWKY